MKNSGGKRVGAGRKAGINKFIKSFTLDLTMKDKHVSSKLVNELLLAHFEQQKRECSLPLT